MAAGIFHAKPKDDLSFGDVCEAPFFCDVHVQDDAGALLRDDASPGFARKKDVEELAVFYPVHAGNPKLQAKPDDDYVLAHGLHHPLAVCLADDCVIASALGRESGDEPSGRLPFAPLTKLVAAEAEYLTPRNFRRMRIGGDRVIELRHCFQVAAETVANGLAEDGLRRRSPIDAMLLDLAVRLAAHTSRLGPLVVAENARKLAGGLAAQAVDEEALKKLILALSATSQAAWRFDARGLEHAGQRYDEHVTDLGKADFAAALADIREDLELLQRAAGDALAALPHG